MAVRHGVVNLHLSLFTCHNRFYHPFHITHLPYLNQIGLTYIYPHFALAFIRLPETLRYIKWALLHFDDGQHLSSSGGSQVAGCVSATSSSALSSSTMSASPVGFCFVSSNQRALKLTRKLDDMSWHVTLIKVRVTMLESSTLISPQPRRQQSYEPWTLSWHYSNTS